LLVEIKSKHGKLQKDINQVKKVLEDNKNKGGIFNEFFEEIAKVRADQKKTEMYVDQQLESTNMKIGQTNTRLDDYKHELDKYDKQFALLRVDQNNVRDDLVSHKEMLVVKINEINDTFLQETTKLRLLCSENLEYSKKNKQDLQDQSSKIKDLEYLTTEHTHKIYDINDLARNNLNEKLDLEKFNVIQKEMEEKIEYNKMSIKDVSNTLKETDNYVEKYLPFKLSNMIAEILEPITDEKGPFANLVPNETQLKEKILYTILNDDGEPALDKDGVKVSKKANQLTHQDSPDISIARKDSFDSIQKNISPQASNLKISPKRMIQEPSESEESLFKNNAEPRDYFNQIVEDDPTPVPLKSPLRSSTVKQSGFAFATAKVIQKQSREDNKFFAKSEEMLKVSNPLTVLDPILH